MSYCREKLYRLELQLEGQAVVINRLREELRSLRGEKAGEKNPQACYWLHVWDGGYSVHTNEQDARKDITQYFQEIDIPPDSLPEPSYLVKVISIARKVSSVIWTEKL